ncbi:hypothetical protein L313_2649 [Acinetobacter haemolyticus CIP 64.3 = MTCC 9819]|uniref:Uncharacterized protein n=1 Tax=Acinetobacter haemolyticus CIP 64.3 = MTCC 9819 TaxID=1217659 RepID=N9GGI7_ACIHA|nr:hypothetical protein [Acinetobacter haemolyticus]ENW16326.1 hypothetical protein F927_02897 [Acinetobacter haemolyticus CIP 64.3 = MTCC 9819]EPR88250.1 hypothetical protein L313_2649 [Acinetobacter haemolyticus CIP 64.3 = MTCC 9819]QXZ27268.1 hypothetical protein I6L22_02895 [Acinetobacter haemolyticus]SPT48178.1 Uncharacterised protein [Acinetobacter haemolyticus]SUU05916.1 Uncharacterised protein [Acinetobacter haemolyticus]
MRKIVYLILLLGLVWLVKLSYDMAQNAQTIPQLQQQLSQTEQRYALLNDQLVALQRQLQSSSPETPSGLNMSPMVITGVAPVILIQQQLQLVQFALDQQQFIYALEHLTQVQQQVLQSSLAPALQHSLLKAIEQDKQSIQQFVLTQTQQQQQLEGLLQELDQRIQKEIQNPQLKTTKDESSIWRHWFNLEKVQRNPPDLVHRNLTLKEAQLRMLLASDALHRGQQAEYRKSIQEVMQLLAELPDQNSQQMNQRLDKILHLPTVATPKLITLGLVG